MDEDSALLEQINNKKKKRPHIAKLLSRKDFDKFELDMLMSTDTESVQELEGFDFDTYEDFE